MCFMCEQLSKHIEDDGTSFLPIKEGCYRCGKGKFEWILGWESGTWVFTYELPVCGVFLYCCPYICKWLYKTRYGNRYRYTQTHAYKHRHKLTLGVCSWKKPSSRSILVAMSTVSTYFLLTFPTKKTLSLLQRNGWFLGQGTQKMTLEHPVVP